MLSCILWILLILSCVIGASQSSEAGTLRIAGVTASSEQAPNVAGNTLDGDLNTRWSAKGDGQWIQYRLETCEVVTNLEIAWYQGDRRTASYAVETSEDGIKWITGLQADTDSAGWGNLLQPADITDQFACFVRIVGFGTSVNRWNSITEVHINGFANPDAPPDPAPGETGVIIPIIGVYASDEQGPNIAANAIDGDFNTRWSAKAERWIREDIEADPGFDPLPEDMTTWIVFEIEECATIHNIYISWYQGDKRVAFYSIELSEDGVDWRREHFGVGGGSNDPGEFHFFSLEHQFGCFIRITGYGNTSNPWNSIAEVLLEGEFPETELNAMN